MKSLVLCSVLLLLLPLFLCAQARQPLIAVGGIAHESNSFNPAKTQLSDFSRRKTAPVDEVLQEWSKSSDIINATHSNLCDLRYPCRRCAAGDLRGWHAGARRYLAGRL